VLKYFTLRIDVHYMVAHSNVFWTTVLYVCMYELFLAVVSGFEIPAFDISELLELERKYGIKVQHERR